MSDLPDAFEPDPVSTLLGSTYLPKWRAIEQTLHHPWEQSVPSGVACLYVVISGDVWFQPSNQEQVTEEQVTEDQAAEGRAAKVQAPIRLCTGDHLVTTRGSAHQITSALGHANSQTKIEDGRRAYPLPIGSRKPGESETPQDRSFNGSTEPSSGSSSPSTTRMLTGQFSLAGLKRNPLNVGLPDVIHLNHHRDAALNICLPMLDLIQTAQRERPAGWISIVQRLGEMILLQTVAEELRTRQGRQPDESDGAFRTMQAATDGVIGPVLRLMVDQPDRAWTVPQMARLAKVSKSAFSDRFRRLVGAPPLQYLTEIRMVRSRHLLRETGVEISDIATLVGYESPSSFSNVFKRWHGMSPNQYRRGEGESDPSHLSEPDTSLRSAQ